MNKVDKKNRRHFLTLTLAGGGAVAASACGLTRSGEGKPSGPRQKVLTANGKLIEVDLADAVSSHHPVQLAIGF